MWPWQNLIVVLTQPGSSSLPLPVLTGLDASTGQARWRLRIGGSVQGSSPTADGGLAIVIWSNLRGDGAAEVVDLSSGRARWTRPVHSDAVPPVAVGGGAVLFNDGGRLTSYDDRTGQVRWTEALSDPPDDVVWQASTGLVYLTWAAEFGGGRAKQVLLGIKAADGRVRWRVVVRFAHTAPPDSLDPSAPGLASVTTSAYSGGTSQDELDPATGRVRWQVVSPYPAIATPAGIVTAPGPGQITMHDTLTGQTLWTASLTSGWQPLVTSTGLISQALPAVPAGPLLIVPAAGPGGSDLLAALRLSDGQPAWQVTLPGTLAAPPSATAGGMLAYTVVPGRVMAP
jgi:outer membrane protein assembly factor BamB